MQPRMRTRSAGRPAAELLGVGTGVRIGRGERGRRLREGNDERADDLNGQGNDPSLRANGGVEGVNGNVEGVNEGVGNQGNVGNQNGNVVNENVQENVGNVIVNGNRVGKALTCHEMQKLKSELWNHAMVGAGYAAYTDKFYELAEGLVPLLVQISGALTDEAVTNGSIKKVEKRGNVGETSKDKNSRDDNKRTRTGNVFANTVNPVGRENMGTVRIHNFRLYLDASHSSDDSSTSGLHNSSVSS
ncbi:hypothetical protein Tco_0412546 [Tanacetum coccineum]